MEKKRGGVLLEALDVINGERQDQYGNPEDTFALIAEYWTIFLGYGISAKEVAMMMALMKVAREQGGAGKRDNVVDACGYLGLYQDMVDRENNADFME